MQELTGAEGPRTLNTLVRQLRQSDLDYLRQAAVQLFSR